MRRIDIAGGVAGVLAGGLPPPGPYARCRPNGWSRGLLTLASLWLGRTKDTRTPRRSPRNLWRRGCIGKPCPSIISSQSTAINPPHSHPYRPMDAALSANLQDIRDTARVLLRLAPPGERRRTRHKDMGLLLGDPRHLWSREPQRAGGSLPAQDMALRTGLFWPQRPLFWDFAFVDKRHIAAGIHPCLPPYLTH